MTDVGSYKIREGTGYQNRRPRLCLDLWSVCYIWQLGAENHPSSFPLKFSPLSYLSHLVLCHSFSPSHPLIYHRYSGIWLRGAAGGAERCKVHFCPPVRACVGLEGGATPAKRTGTVLLSCCIPVKEAYGKEGVWQGVGWTRVELGLECDCRLPPLFSCLVPFCPASRGAVGQTNAPA